jgi:alcohol dehydrogenase class IV
MIEEIRPFQFAGTPKIIFGPGSADSIHKWIGNHGKSMLVVTGSNAYLTNSEIARLIKSLENAPVPVSYARIGNEPSPSDIDAILSENRKDIPDMVMAIGGGSVIDAGKAVSAMLPLEGNTRDYLEGVGTKSHPGIKKFFVAVPTTAGTGSEATYNAVISETGKNGFKRSLRHEKLLPDIAVVDPRLLLACPPHVTAQSGMDAFTQLIESYLSLKSNPITDALALKGIGYIHKSLKLSFEDGSNLNARTEMSMAALFSGITLSGAGLGLVHGFASSVGGFADIPHGVVCGTLMGIINRFTVDALLAQSGTTESHMKYAALGRVFSGSLDKSTAWYMKYAASYIESLADFFKIPPLGQFGISEADLSQIAANTDHKAHPVTFSNEVLVEMLRERMK